MSVETFRAVQEPPQEESVEQTPSVGRIVHYTNLGDAEGKYPPQIQAAIITGVNDDGTVALKVFYKTGLFDMPSAVYDDTGRRGTWRWPPRT